MAQHLSRSYKLGIIANQHHSIINKLEKAGLLNYFTLADVSEDYHFEKPDPRLFTAVFSATGAIPTRSIMIDDNIERGLAPAKKFGMTTVWYKLREYSKPLSSVDYTITNLIELENIL